MERWVRAYREGGLAGLRQRGAHRPVSDLAAYEAVIRESFAAQPVSTIAEACVRIERLTGLRRGQTQVRRYLKSLGLTWRRMRAIPVPPQKTSPSTSPSRPSFSTRN